MKTRTGLTRSVSITTDLVHAQVLVKLLQNIPKGTTVQQVHALNASGLLPVGLRADLPELMKFGAFTLWRDRLNALFGLPPASLGFRYRTPKSRYREFANRIRCRDIPEGRLKHQLLRAIKKPEHSHIGDYYISDDDVVLASFGSGVKVRDALAVVSELGHRPVRDIRKYIKFLSWLERRNVEDVPGEVLDAPILGGFDEDDRAHFVPKDDKATGFLFGYKRLNENRVVVEHQILSTFSKRTWMMIEPPKKESSTSSGCCPPGFDGDWS